MFGDLEEGDGDGCRETLLRLVMFLNAEEDVRTCDGPPASQMYEWVKKERIMYALCHSLSEMRCSVDSIGN